MTNPLSREFQCSTWADSSRAIAFMYASGLRSSGLVPKNAVTCITVAVFSSRILELLTVFFDGLSNVVGVSGEKRLKRHIFVCGGDIDLADYMADRPTDVWV